MIKSVQNISFKAYVPVSYYAKNPANGQYVPVIKKENIRKCHGFVVRNLNGTAKRNKNEKFVDFYKAHDADYRRNPKVQSVYDRNLPVVYMVSGNDVDVVTELAKPVGKAKSESLDLIGHSNSFESSRAANEFFKNVRSFLNKSCRRLKSDDKQNLSLRVYFDPKYNTKDKLVSFNFVNARFIKEES